MSTETHDALDAAIRAHMLDEFAEKGGLVTHWAVSAAGYDDLGEPRIMGEFSSQDMPRWQVRGLLGDALYELDQPDG